MKLKSPGKKQTLALLALVSMSIGGGMVSAKDYTAPMTGNSETDTAYSDVVSVDKSNNTTYTFTEDNTITVSGGTPLEFTSSLSGEKFKATTAMTAINSTYATYKYMYVNSPNNNLTLNVTAEGEAIGAGILLTGDNNLPITYTPASETEIKVTGAEGNTQKSYGIWRAVTDSTTKTINMNMYNAKGGTSHLSITVNNKNGGYGVAVSRPENLTLTDEQKKSFYNGSGITIGFNTVATNLDVKVAKNQNASVATDESAGLYVDANNGKITIKGTANLDVEGHGILLTSEPSGTSQSQQIQVTNGGKITVHPDKDGAERYAIYNEKGSVLYGSTLVNGITTQIDGDIYIGEKASVTIGLKGDGAYFNGSIKENDNFNQMILTLSDRAIWTNTATNTANIGINTRLTRISGVNGFIHQTKDSGKITVDLLDSKQLNIAYDHDISDPTKVLGGDVTITSAQTDSYINVFTDYDDNMSTETVRENVLNALAQKIYYTKYTTGETNLTGQVSIAEGLTAASATKYFADMSFSETTGQGYLAEDTEIETYSKPDTQTVTEFSNVLSRYPDATEPYAEAGVYDNEVFTFTKDSKLTLDSTCPDFAGGAWMRNLSAGIYTGAKMPVTTVDLQGHNLDISVETAKITTGISAIGSDALVEINNAGAINISATCTKTGQTGAVYANAGGQVYIHNGGENQEQKILTLRASSNSSINCAVLKTMNGVANVRSWIKIDGLIDLEADTTNGVGAAEGISAVASTIDVGGGKIISTASGTGNKINGVKGATNCAIRAYGEFVSDNYARVNVNVIKDKDSAAGEAIAAGNNRVQMEGDVITCGGMGTKGKISIGLNTEDSYWKGNYKFSSGWGVTPGEYGIVKVFMGNKAKWTGYTLYDTILKMDSGAEWEGYALASTSADSNGRGVMDATIQNGAIWRNVNDSENDTVLYKLTGGDSASSAGYIDMTRAEKETTIQNYAGYMKVMYAHDEADPTSISGANITIDSAAEGSDITLLTDNTGFDVHDEDKTVEVIGSLAKKLIYKGAIPGEEDGAVAENNLSGHVGIAEGLTSSSAVIKLGDMTFSSEDGVGSYEVGSLHTPSADIIYGDNETAMMKGSKSAMASLALLWRAENNDLMKRMGDLRMNPGETGVWAKYYGGKNTFDSQNTDISVRYNAAQVGFDREVGKNWKMGIALSHNTGDASIGNGDADLKSTSIGVYGTWQHDNGSYADIIFKASKLDNEYDVFNTYGHKLNGDYDVWGTSFSAEIGKRFTYENGLTVDPSIEFTYGNIEGKTYDAQSDYSGGKALHVDQDRFSSFIGRLGVKVGKTTKRANYYAKLALAHEFLGDFDTTFSADNEPTGKTHLEFAGTWLEARLGVNAKLSDRSNFYADVEKTFGGDIKETWRLDAGFRLSF